MHIGLSSYWFNIPSGQFSNYSAVFKMCHSSQIHALDWFYNSNSGQGSWLAWYLEPSVKLMWKKNNLLYGYVMQDTCIQDVQDIIKNRNRWKIGNLQWGKKNNSFSKFSGMWSIDWFTYAQLIMLRVNHSSLSVLSYLISIYMLKGVLHTVNFLSLIFLNYFHSWAPIIKSLKSV